MFNGNRGLLHAFPSRMEVTQHHHTRYRRANARVHEATLSLGNGPYNGGTYQLTRVGMERLHR